MRAIILTAHGLEHVYVANGLIEALGDRVAAVVLESRRSSLGSALRRYGALRICERILTKMERRLLRHGARQANALRSVLLSSERRWPASVKVLETRSVNAPQTRGLIRRLSPTHLFVYGTGIVGPGTTTLARCSLNMHTGLSPWYRGSDTEFWPMYRGEPHMVGITVHDVTPAVDGGAIYARASVRLEPDDDPFIAFARCVRVGAAIYARIATRLAAGEVLTPEPQDLNVGRSYRFADRTLVQDLVMEYRIRTGKTRRQIQGNVAPLPFPAIDKR